MERETRLIFLMALSLLQRYQNGRRIYNSNYDVGDSSQNVVEPGVCRWFTLNEGRNSDYLKLMSFSSGQGVRCSRNLEQKLHQMEKIKLNTAWNSGNLKNKRDINARQFIIGKKSRKFANARKVKSESLQPVFQISINYCLSKNIVGPCKLKANVRVLVIL